MVELSNNLCGEDLYIKIQRDKNRRRLIEYLRKGTLVYATVELRTLDKSHFRKYHDNTGMYS